MFAIAFTSITKLFIVSKYVYKVFENIVSLNMIYNLKSSPNIIELDTEPMFQKGDVITINDDPIFKGDLRVTKSHIKDGTTFIEVEPV